MTLKCGCVFDGKSFVKHCREHATMVLKKRVERNGPFYAPKKAKR